MLPAAIPLRSPGAATANQGPDPRKKNHVAAGFRRSRFAAFPSDAAGASYSRALLRSNELALVVASALVGVVAAASVAAMTATANLMHVLIFNLPFDVRLSAVDRVAPVAAFARSHARRTEPRPDGGLSPSKRDSRPGRSGRSQRPARRPHVAARQFHRRDADPDLQFLRRLGGAGGGLHPGRIGSRLVPRAEIAPAPQRFAPAGGRRSGGGDRRLLRRAADRRLLRLRGRPRQLFHRGGGADLHRFDRRRPRHAFSCRRALPDQHACGRSAQALGLSGLVRPGRLRRGDRRRRHARRRRVGARAPVHAHAGLGAARDRRARRGGAGDDHAAGARRRPWRPRAEHFRPFPACGARGLPGVEAGRLPDFAGQRLSRRPVFRVAVHGRDAGQDLRTGDGRPVSRPGARTRPSAFSREWRRSAW